MLLKFFPLLPTKALVFCRPAIWVSLFAFASTITARSQSPTPSPSSTPKPKRAYVRLWNMVPSQPPTAVELVYSDKPITTAASCNFYAGYLPVLPGAFAFTVRRAGDKTGSIKQLLVNLKPDDFATILVSDKSGKPDAELIDDTVDPKNPNPRRLVLRQLFPNAKVLAYLGTTPTGSALGYGETATLDSVPAGVSTLTVQAIIPGQSPKSWSMPLELSQSQRDTLLIFPDPYGRFRPRLAVDAQVPPDTGASR